MFDVNFVKCHNKEQEQKTLHSGVSLSLLQQRWIEFMFLFCLSIISSDVSEVDFVGREKEEKFSNWKDFSCDILRKRPTSHHIMHSAYSSGKKAPHIKF